MLEIAAFKADHLQTVCIVSWRRRWKSRLKVNPDLKNAQDEPCSCSEGQPCDWSERSAEVSDLMWERVGGRRTLHSAAIATSSTNDWCASWRGNVQKVASPRGAAFVFFFCIRQHVIKALRPERNNCGEVLAYVNVNIYILDHMIWSLCKHMGGRLRGWSPICLSESKGLWAHWTVSILLIAAKRKNKQKNKKPKTKQNPTHTHQACDSTGELWSQ